MIKPTYEELEKRIQELEKVEAERKKIEEALGESETRYRTIFEASADGILMTDVQTMRFKYANPAFYKMFGYSDEE